MSNRLVTHWHCLNIFKNNTNAFIVELQNKIGDHEYKITNGLYYIYDND